MRTCILISIATVLKWGAAPAYALATDRPARLDGRAVAPCYGVQDASDGSAYCQPTNVRRAHHRDNATGEQPNAGSAAAGAPGSQNHTDASQAMHRVQDAARNATANSAVSGSVLGSSNSTGIVPATVPIPIPTHETTQEGSPPPSTTTKPCNCNSSRTPAHGVPTPQVNNAVVDKAKEEAVNGYDDPSTTSDTPYESRRPTPEAVGDDVMRTPGDEEGEIKGKMDGEERKWEEGGYGASPRPESPTPTPTPTPCPSGKSASATPDGK